MNGASKRRVTLAQAATLPASELEDLRVSDLDLMTPAQTVGGVRVVGRAAGHRPRRGRGHGRRAAPPISFMRQRRAKAFRACLNAMRPTLRPIEARRSASP